MDDLTNDDYTEIMQEIRGYDPSLDAYATPIRAFIARIGSVYSVAQWSKLQRRLLTRIPWPMKNELRKAVGLPDAPMDAQDVAEQIAAGKLPYTIQNGRAHVGKTRSRPRAKRMAVSLPLETGAALNDARQAAGLSWQQLAERALEVLRPDDPA